MSLLLFLQVDGFSQRQQDDDHAIRGLAGAWNISFDPVNAAFHEQDRTVTTSESSICSGAEYTRGKLRLARFAGSQKHSSIYPGSDAVNGVDDEDSDWGIDDQIRNK
jgi:hypothetical protein